MFIDKIFNKFKKKPINRVDGSNAIQIGFKVNDEDYRIVELPRQSYSYTLEVGEDKSTIVLKTDVYVSQIITISDELMSANKLKPISEVIGSDDNFFVYFFEVDDLEIEEDSSLKYMEDNYLMEIIE